MAGLAALTSETSFSGATPDATDASSNPASFSSTPPTTVSPDSMSLASEPEISKHDANITATPLLDATAAILENERRQPQTSRQQTPVGLAIVVAEEPLPSEPSSASRSRRARASLPVYNLAKLSGTDAHGKRRAKGDSVGEKRRRTISGDTLVNDDQEGSAGSTDAPAKANRVAKDAVDASNIESTPAGPSSFRGARVTRRLKENSAAAQAARRATRLSGAPVETLATKLSTLGKRGKKTFEKSLSRMSRELRRLQDTNEFAHIETAPVKYTVWSNGKYIEVDPNAPEQVASPPRKKAKLEDNAAAAATALGATDGEEASKPEAEAPPVRRRRVKKYLEKGLYAGQDAPMDISKGLTAKEKKKLVSIPELMPSGEVNKTLPFPIFNGLRLLLNGRDFKLPYDVCNPLPPGQPKPAAYRTMTKSEPSPLSSAYCKM